MTSREYIRTPGPRGHRRFEREARPPAEARLRNDGLRMGALILVFLILGAVFFLSPLLSTPSFLALSAALILAPLVARLERHGIARAHSVLLIFLGVGLVLGLLGFVTARSLAIQWNSFLNQAPAEFDTIIQHLHKKEALIKTEFPLLKSVRITDTIVRTANSTSRWFIQNTPNWMGQILNILILVPIFTFFLLNNGPNLRRRVYLLIPNRFFESVFMVFWRISVSITGYLRAKFLEAFLVGAMTSIGLAVVGAPYALVLGAIAGLTNIIPYVGPLLGAAPALMIAGFGSTHAAIFWPICGVYLAANLVDNFLIFPVIVAKLVDLPPIVLIVAVILGQQYYGLVGMLISIPVATSLKIILQEVVAVAYASPNASEHG